MTQWTRQEWYNYLRHLWWLVVFWCHSDVKADPSDCFAQTVSDRENKLDVLGVRADVHDWRHVGYLHEVHCMLETRQNINHWVFDKSVHTCTFNVLKTQSVTCVKSLRTGALESLVNLGILSTRNNLPASGVLHIKSGAQCSHRILLCSPVYRFCF